MNKWVLYRGVRGGRILFFEEATLDTTGKELLGLYEAEIFNRLHNMLESRVFEESEWIRMGRGGSDTLGHLGTLLHKYRHQEDGPQRLWLSLLAEQADLLIPPTLRLGLILLDSNRLEDAMDRHLPTLAKLHRALVAVRVEIPEDFFHTLES